MYRVGKTERPEKMKVFFAIIREFLTGQVYCFFWDEGEKPEDYDPHEYFHDN